MLVKPTLFLSSYAPLLFMFAFVFKTPWLRWVCVGLGLLGILALVLLFLANKSSSTGQPLKVKSVSNAGAAASAYLAGYLLPFISTAEPEVAELGAYCIFFIVAYAVNSKTGLLQVNPLIFLMPGRSLQMITFETGVGAYLVIVKGVVRVGDEIQLKSIGTEDVYKM